MILKLLYIIYSKSAKLTLSVCVAVGKFVCDVSGGKPVRSFLAYVLFVYIFIISRSGMGSSLPFTMMSSKQK